MRQKKAECSTESGPPWPYWVGPWLRVWVVDGVPEKEALQECRQEPDGLADSVEVWDTDSVVGVQDPADGLTRGW